MGSSEHKRSFGHTSAILENINANDPPEAVAKGLTGYFPALILDMQGEYCPTWPKYSDASYHSSLDDWKRAVDCTEDPVLRSEIVSVADEKLSGLLESNQDAVYAAMGKVTRGDYDVMSKYARQSDLKQFQNMPFSQVSQNVLIFD